MIDLANAKMHQRYFGDLGGIHAIATGMHLSPTELSEIMWVERKSKDQLEKHWAPFIETLNKRKNKWKQSAEKSEKTYDFLKREIYNE